MIYHLDLLLPSKVSPLQERGFSIFVRCVGVLVVCLCDRYKRYIRNCLFHMKSLWSLWVEVPYASSLINAYTVDIISVNESATRYVRNVPSKI